MRDMWHLIAVGPENGFCDKLEADSTFSENLRYIDKCLLKVP